MPRVTQNKPLAIAFVCILSLSSRAPVLRAQNSESAKFAVISGTAVDSIRGGYLIGAVVRVIGTTQAATTDSLGRFRIDGIAAGSHQIELIHPLLDTLGMVLKTPSIKFTAGENAAIRLSIPSGMTVVTVKCSEADRKAGEAALIGMVFEAEGDAPAVGADISLEWIDLVPADKGFRKVVQKRTAATQADGSFRICALPSDLSANAIATRGSDSTSVVGVRLSRFLGLITLFLPARADAKMIGGREERKSGVLMGKIFGPTGAAVEHARILIDGEDAAAISDNDGKFVLGHLRSGTRTVSVRALGYQPVEKVVTISALEPRMVYFKLDKFVPVLKSVQISAVRDAGLERVGFTDRKRDQPAGRFFRPEDIERRNPLKLAHLLEHVPELNGAPCIRYVIDGVMLPQGFIDDTPDSFLNAAELGAVEVYSHINQPGEYVALCRSHNTAAIVVIWTKFRLGL